METINDNEVETELPIVDEKSTDTGNEVEEETVETFDEALESAETDEDFAKLADQARPDESGELASEEGIDTPVEEEVTHNSFDIGNGFAIKDGDIELNITDEAKLRQLAQMGLNYGGKTTELAKHRSFIQYAEENDISLNDIQMLRDIKGGNKDAYSALAKNSGIDVYDVSEEHTYNPEPVQQTQQIDPMVDQIATEILSNDEYTSQFQKWVNNDRMPPEVVQQITNDSSALRAVQADMQAGIFDRAMHAAYSDVKVNGAEFNSAYLKAKEMIVGTTTPAATQQQPITRGERQRASASRGKASSQKTFGSVSDMSDDDFLNNFQDIVNGLERPQ